MKLGQFIKSNPKTILTLLGIGISVYLMLAFNLDVRAIALSLCCWDISPTYLLD